MNRAALIIIVDFLLISLLAFSRLDQQELTIDENSGIPSTFTTERPQQDLMQVLQLSLDQERESREQLHDQLREVQTELETREQTLSEREKLIRDAERLLQLKAEETARLARERAAMERQFQMTQSNVAELQKELTNTLTEASRSRQSLEAVRNDLAAREQEESILKRRLSELEKNRLAAEAEKKELAARLQAAEAEKERVRQEQQQLAAKLQAAETEKQLVREQLSSVKGEVQVERQEKAKLQEHATKLQEHASKLAEGVTALAEHSGELTKEIRENRPLAPNTVFSDFVTNRVRGDFRAVRTGLLGREVNREKEAKSVLVRHGNQVYALYHVNDTPLSFSAPGMDWDWLIGNIRRGSAVARVERISFLAMDPRVVVVPISDAKARELGAKIYSLPEDPFRFQEAILIGADEGYYGECRFQLDAENRQYVRLQRERFSWLVGKFAPSSGDLVFTKNGDLLGLMVNKDYCLLLTQFSPAYHLQTGIGIGDQQTGPLLSQLSSQVTRMPAKLQ